MRKLIFSLTIAICLAGCQTTKYELCEGENCAPSVPVIVE